MVTSCLYAFVVLYSSLKGAYGVNSQCELLEERTCLGSNLDYNFTTTDLVTDSQTQLEVKDKLKQWEGLKFLSRCWRVLQPLLCQVYKPRCQNSSVQLPCREQCLATRNPCSVVERYHKEWPDFLKCEQFPLGSCKGGSVSGQLNCNRKYVLLVVGLERKEYLVWTACHYFVITNLLSRGTWRICVHVLFLNSKVLLISQAVTAVWFAKNYYFQRRTKFTLLQKDGQVCFVTGN